MGKAGKENAKRSAASIVLNVIIYVICGILIVCAIWLGVDKFVLKNPVPSIGPYSILRVATGSMTPTICENDIIIIKDTGDYVLKDIITFIPTGETSPTTHRIINYDEENNFITKGDYKYNSIDTEHIKPSQVMGEVIFTVRTGAMLLWFKDMGWLYLLAIALIIGMGVLLLKYDEANTRAKEALEQVANAEQGESASGAQNNFENNSEGENTEPEDENTENNAEDEAKDEVTNEAEDDAE